MADDNDTREVILDLGIWEDDLGKHMRFSVVELGVSYTLDILPIEEKHAGAQASAVIEMAQSMPDLISEIVDHAHQCGPGCEQGGTR